MNGLFLSIKNIEIKFIKIKQETLYIAKLFRNEKYSRFFVYDAVVAVRLVLGIIMNTMMFVKRNFVFIKILYFNQNYTIYRI